MKRIGLLIAFVALAVLLVACGQSGPGATKNLGPGDSGAKVTLAKGDELVVDATNNPATGTKWLVVAGDEKVIAQKGESTYLGATADGKIAAPGVDRLTFLAKKSGTTKLHLQLRNPDKKDSPPLSNYFVEVTVQ